MATHTAMNQGNDPSLRASLERKVGILHFVSPKEHGWNGVLRKRFTDFQVHEIDELGEVVHLNDYFTNVTDYDRATTKNAEPLSVHSAEGEAQVRATESDAAIASSAKVESMTGDKSTPLKTAESEPTKSSAELSLKSTVDGTASKERSTDGVTQSDRAKLEEYLGEAATSELVDLYNKILANPKARPQSHGLVKFPQIADKSARTALHSEIRRIFASKIETETNSDGIIQAKAQPARGNSRRGNRNNQSGQIQIGKYLHFSLYKENKDTMEAINILAGALNMKPNFFSTAGTKDRRAVTVQRVSIRGRDPRKIISANAKLRGIAIGDFKFSEKDLYLGSHNGNEFTIVLKDCSFQGFEKESFERRLEIAQSTLDQALTDISKKGFINYFGTQRFGTYEIGTQILGMKILQGDFQGVIQDILSFDPDLAATDSSALHNDNNRLVDMYRAKALAKYKDSNDPDAAMKALPKRCNTEFTILKHLSKSPNDFHGAILAITRNMRNMYLHAYQSLVWNFVASKRWELFGAAVVKGDLVYDDATGASKAGTNDQIADDDDEENLHLRATDSTEDVPRQSVRALTTEDVASGRYSITDVVLSIPGTNVIYPDNEIGEFYKEFMSKEENGAIDPYNMGRSQKAFSLAGDYRKFMGTFVQTPSGSVRTYTHDNDQLVPTDLDLIRARRNKSRAETAAAAQGQPSSGWNSFAKNVQADERKEASEKLVTAQRRKAEEIDDGTAEMRVKETWVQTSTNGGNKRMKVESTSNEAHHHRNANEGGHAMDVEKPAVSQKDTPVSADIVGSPEQNETNSTSTQETSSQSRPSTLEINPVLPQSTGETNDNKQDVITTITSAQTIDTPMVDAISEAQLKVDTNTKPQNEVTQQEPPSSSTEEQKIAIVLKFSLGSSAYATMVLRELQG